MDWCLSAALRALNRLCSQWTGDLAWLLPSRRGLRLVLIRAGVPELDRCVSFDADDPLVAWEELEQLVDAWQRINPAVPLGWWLSLPEEERNGWAGRCIQARGGPGWIMKSQERRRPGIHWTPPSSILWWSWFFQRCGERA